jgi:hypothetical protein
MTTIVSNPDYIRIQMGQWIWVLDWESGSSQAKIVFKKRKKKEI